MNLRSEILKNILVPKGGRVYEINGPTSWYRCKFEEIMSELGDRPKGGWIVHYA